MKQLLILFTLLIFKATPTVCQKECNTFQCAFDEAERLYKDSKSVDRFGRALVNLEGAENLAGNDESNKKQVRELRAKIFDAITEQNKMLKKATETANSERENSDRLLKELRETSDQAVLLVLNEIDRNILRLEYDSTFEKCQIAVNLKSEKYKQQVKERVFEIAYWYTETDTLNAALKVLKLLNINTTSNRNNLLKAIEQNAPPQYFTFLEERYYPKMMAVKGGVLRMKDSKEQYDVTLKDFKMAQTETTVWQYFLYLKTHHQQPHDTPTWQYWGDNPMVYVSWYDAVVYANWISKRRSKNDLYDINKNQKDVHNLNSFDTVKWIVNVKQTQGYRLPTEAEWEYAANSGKKALDISYSGDSDLKNVGWFMDNSMNRTHAVGIKKPNTFGIYDLSGNVWEWCHDWYSEKLNVSSSQNWVSPEKGEYRSLRGGSWAAPENDCQVTNRYRFNADYQRSSYGFRLVECLQDK